MKNNDTKKIMAEGTFTATTPKASDEYSLEQLLMKAMESHKGVEPTAAIVVLPEMFKKLKKCPGMSVVDTAMYGVPVYVEDTQIEVVKFASKLFREGRAVLFQCGEKFVELDQELFDRLNTVKG